MLFTKRSTKIIGDFLRTFHELGGNEKMVLKVTSQIGGIYTASVCLVHETD